MYTFLKQKMDATNMLNTNTRIGVIGAGAAGLSAAWALRKKGYKNITVLEKEASAGGKCHTFYYQDRNFELGAVAINHSYKRTIEIIKELEVKTISLQTSRVFLNNNGEEIELMNKSEKIKFMWQVFVYLPYLYLKHRNIFSPGFKNISSELYQPFEYFCMQNNLDIFENFSNIVCAPYGYGYFDRVPTAYYFKYLRFDFLLAIIRQNYSIISEGYATVWQKLAEQFDVRYQQQITNIKRNEKIQIQTQKKVFEFDKIILACPLDNSLGFVDATPDEQQLFSKIKYNKYYTFAWVVENMPKKDRGYFPANFSPERQGHILCWYQRYPEINLYIFYAIADEMQEEQDIEKITIEDLKKIGATLKEKYTSAQWKYFPHVAPADMKNNFYDKLENLQGINNTYFVGELLNFSNVEGVVEYSCDLVKRFF
jgi:Flavin containing amine oxidoreductase